MVVHGSPDPSLKGPPKPSQSLSRDCRVWGSSLRVRRSHSGLCFLELGDRELRREEEMSEETSSSKCLFATPAPLDSAGPLSACEPHDISRFLILNLVKLSRPSFSIPILSFANFPGPQGRSRRRRARIAPGRSPSRRTGRASTDTPSRPASGIGAWG